MRIERYEGPDGSFELLVPDGWSAERDEADGGLLVSAEGGEGLLHLMPFEREAGEGVDPAEELYAFLEDQEIELEEDEVEDVELEGEAAAAVCEYISEDGDESVYWLVGVVTAPGQLLFASYSCALGAEEREREVVMNILRGLRFTHLDG
jgi:hypothetical protein